MKNEDLDQFKIKLLKKFLEIIFLTELKSNPQSAFSLMKRLPKKFGYNISAGTVYSQLYKMERKNLVKGETTETKPKRIYKITKKGSRLIENLQMGKDEIIEFMKDIL